jgi:uncharacterized protein YndB with AHSA1/START domain
VNDLPHALERELVIRAERATVFAFLTDSERFARWWGVGSSIEARVGGAVRIVYPGGVVAEGSVLELEAPGRIVFSYGYASGQPVPSGSTRVTLRFDEVAGGTRVRLTHDFADASVRDAHVDGWRYQLALFAGVACAEQHSRLAARCDEWFAAWNETDTAARARLLEQCASAAVEFRDAYGCVVGREELGLHIAAVQRHMAGMRIEREGTPREVQGTALVDWRVPGPGGTVAARGTNALELAPDGRLARVTGFRAPGPAPAG